jgi:Protein of unknown function (DUF3011)
MWATSRPLWTMTVALALAVPAGVAADEQTLRCESKKYRYNYCSADTDGRVTLTRQLSNRRCVLWESWGYDKRGVWVDKGCSGEFRVGRDGLSGGQTAAIGAVAGAAIIAAIVASHKHGDKDKDVSQPPHWMIGRFRAFDPESSGEWDITIERNGRVAGYADNRPLSGDYIKDRLHLGTAIFKVKKESWGFRGTRVDSDQSALYFRRLDE